MPSDAGDSCHRLELMHDLAGDEVDVIVSQLDAGVADTLPVQLIQLGVLKPGHTLKCMTNRMAVVNITHYITIIIIITELICR